MEVASIPAALPGKKPSRVMERQYRAGFDNFVFDLSAYCGSYELENREEYAKKREELPESIFLSAEPKRIWEKSEPFLLQCRELGAISTMGIAPFSYWNTKRDDLDALTVELTVGSIFACQKAGCRAILIYPLYKQMQSGEEREKNIQFYLSFVEQIKDTDIKILIPNHYREQNGHYVRGEFTDEEELARFTDELNRKAGGMYFGLCVDVGMCNLCGQNVQEVLETLGERIRAVILRENDGTADDKLLPFTSIHGRQSCMDWMGIIRGLREIAFDGLLVFDFRDAVLAMSHLLREDFDLFAKKTADYLVWQIEMERTVKKYGTRVLFGAGNMCRNYMKCYGKEYPPLFTCDNNEALWETEFAGLTIKNPEELKKLPDECAIFICNIYYDEIKAQLLEMGLVNPIVYFNDEYMPSLYFDRLNARTREIR